MDGVVAPMGVTDTSVGTSRCFQGVETLPRVAADVLRALLALLDECVVLNEKEREDVEVERRGVVARSTPRPARWSCVAYGTG